jgi:hypothetical protein
MMPNSIRQYFFYRSTLQSQNTSNTALLEVVRDGALHWELQLSTLEKR